MAGQIGAVKGIRAFGHAMLQASPAPHATRRVSCPHARRSPAGETAPVTMETIVIRNPEPYGASLALVRRQVSPRKSMTIGPVGALMGGAALLLASAPCAQNSDPGVLKLPQEQRDA